MNHKYTLKQRQNLILQKLHEENIVFIKNLMAQFGISEVSVRKDLAALEEKGLLIRVKGGAVNLHQDSATGFISSATKATLNAPQKQAIARFAAGLVENGETILLDSGTTCLELAKNLGEKEGLTVVTNSISAAQVIMRMEKSSVILLGGMVYPASESTVGQDAAEMLRNYWCDKLFVGVDSCNMNGISTPYIVEAGLNQAMIESAGEIIAVFDSSKFGQRRLAHICDLDKLDAVVTDSGIPDEYREYLIKLGKRLYIVDDF